MTESSHDSIREAMMAMRKYGRTVSVRRYNGELRIHPERKDIGDRFIVTGYQIENINDDALADEWGSNGLKVLKLLANHEFQIEQ